MTEPLGDQEFWQLFHEGDAEYPRSREALKNNPHKPISWEEATPPHLKPAVKYLRKQFEREKQQLSMKAECGCYLGLHPQLALMPKPKLGVENLIPPQNRAVWQKTYTGIKESEIFKLWSDEFSEGLGELIAAPFTAFLNIGLAQRSALSLQPVEWATAFLEDLLYGLEFTLPRFIKDMCDEQDIRSDDLSTENFLGYCAWVYWRAPRFVHMQPSGNTPYNSATAWERENVERTHHLLASLSRRMLDPARFNLTKLAGEAHVSLACTSVLPPMATQAGPAEPQLGSPAPEPSSITSSKLRNTLELPAVSSPDSADNLPSKKTSSHLNYRSSLKRAVVVQLVRNREATDLQICRGLDEEGAVELPSGWSARGNRLFESAYKDPSVRPRIEAAISKVRADLRNQGHLS